MAKQYDLIMTTGAAPKPTRYPNYVKYKAVPDGQWMMLVQPVRTDVNDTMALRAEARRARRRLRRSAQ